MKIVLFDYVFEQGKPGISGLSDVVWQMGRSLAKLGEDIHLVGPYAKGTVGPQGITMHPYMIPTIRNIVGHIRIALKGWQTIQREIPDADLIHTPEYLSTTTFALLGSLPVVLTTPGNVYAHLHNRANFFGDPITTSVCKVAARISAKRCAYIIAISKDMQYWWEYSGASPNKIAVIPYGVDIKTFSPIANANHRLGWDDHREHLLYVGRLSHEKGVDLLIEAFRQVATDFPNAYLHIIGDGPERQALLSLTEQSRLTEKVIFYGWVKKHELPSYYSAADVCVVPSRTEALGRIILESMACQTPVVGANVGGIPDLIKDNETGLLFEKEDVCDLEQKLRRVLEEGARAQEMARAGWRFIRTHQSWESVARRIRDEVYRPIVEEGARGR